MLFRSVSVPAIVNIPEFMRRMSEMNRYYQMNETFSDVTLIVNTANPAVNALKEAKEEDRKLAIMQIYYLALSTYRPLTPEESAELTEDTAKILEKFLKNS